jgi:hypothetical protein
MKILFIGGTGLNSSTCSELHSRGARAVHPQPIGFKKISPSFEGDPASRRYPCAGSAAGLAPGVIVSTRWWFEEHPEFEVMDGKRMWARIIWAMPFDA